MTLEKKIGLQDKRIFFLDKDGTLAIGDNALPGSVSFLKHLREKGKIFYVLSNNSSKTPKMHMDSLKKAGINVGEENILVSLHAALDFFRSSGFRSVYWAANKEVGDYIENEGFKFEEQNPEAALLTYDTEINYNKLVKIVELVRKGIPYYSTHIDLVCPAPSGSLPDVGTFIEVIRLTTGVLPKRTFGKPDKGLISSTLKKHSLFEKDAVIIGDRLYTDIKLAENSDITSVLVLSGETKKEDYESSKIRADIIVDGIDELLDFI
jgi:HAD superfamily hydrolase (TIGR01450 family)